VSRFKLQSVDETFLDTAPTRYAEAFEIALPAGAVWGELVADGALSFCRSLRGARWTSARPFGVGTTRTMPSLFGALVVEETYFRWEEGRRQSFYVHHASLPLFRRFAEDYLVEETSPTTSRFTWTIALDPHPLARLGEPVNKLVIEGLFKDTRRHFPATE
jgi:Polyketide cyclase / dehydrase and lipid transport